MLMAWLRHEDVLDMSKWRHVVDGFHADPRFGELTLVVVCYNLEVV